MDEMTVGTWILWGVAMDLVIALLILVAVRAIT